MRSRYWHRFLSWQTNRMRTSVEMRNRRCVGEAEEALLALLFIPVRRYFHRDVYSQLNEDTVSDEDYEKQS